MNVSDLRPPASGEHSFRPAVFLDRDGVLIENRAMYVRSLDDMTVLPGATEAVHRLSASPFAIVVVTNQSAIARGLTTRAKVDLVNAALGDEIARHGGRVDAFYVCPHAPDDACTCRKPEPGMLRTAANELSIDLARSYLVGDAVSDMRAAEAAGVRPILVLTGRGARELSTLSRRMRNRCVVAPDTQAAVDYILAT
jgi:D-glycero-D-manno-heptose 1,7-bisphosphate phosphatase